MPLTSPRCNPYLPIHRTRGRKWYHDEKQALEELRDHRKFNKFWGHTTFATLNVRSLGWKRSDSDFYYSYLESLGHDALDATEMWGTERRYDSWRCVTSEPNLTGDDRPSGVCILLSRRFASRQLQRGRLGRRGCWV